MGKETKGRFRTARKLRSNKDYKVLFRIRRSRVRSQINISALTAAIGIMLKLFKGMEN